MLLTCKVLCDPCHPGGPIQLFSEQNRPNQCISYDFLSSHVGLPTIIQLHYLHTHIEDGKQGYNTNYEVLEPGFVNFCVRHWCLCGLVYQCDAGCRVGGTWRFLYRMPLRFMMHIIHTQNQKAVCFVLITVSNKSRH